MSLPLPERQDDGWYVYTADQLREYGQQCRAAALEEAAAVCDRDWSCDTSSYETYAEINKCAQAIRSLKP